MKKAVPLGFALVMWIAVAQSVAAQGGLAALAQSGVEGPVIVMDLVKFKPDGATHYATYDAIAEKKLTSLGGEVVFRGPSRAVDGLDSTAWDRVTLRKYPTVQAVLEMGGSREYQGAFPHRMAGVEASFVYAFSGELPSFGGAKPGTDPMKVVAQPASGEAVYMLNLLRFNDDGGREQYYGEYGMRVSPLIQACGGGSVLMLKGLGPVIATEEIDRLILVRYPSPKAFRDMIDSAEYRAVAHHRTGAIEVGLIWPFAHTVSEESTAQER